jgi:hypothetical protein
MEKMESFVASIWNTGRSIIFPKGQELKRKGKVTSYSGLSLPEELVP